MCAVLSRVTFGESSSLKVIGDEAFSETSLSEISIPDRVESLGEKCLFGCPMLSRLTFGTLSSLQVIGARAFHETGLKEIRVPYRLENFVRKQITRQVRVVRLA